MKKIEQDIVTPTGDAECFVADHLDDQGKPLVFVLFRKDAEGVFEATLDGKPAFAVVLSEQPDGKDNTGWQLGHEVAAAWTRAEKRSKELANPAS